LLHITNCIFRFSEYFTPENCALLGNYAACCGNSLPTFRDNISVPAGVSNPKIWWPETSVMKYHYTLRITSDEHILIYCATEAWNLTFFAHLLPHRRH